MTEFYSDRVFGPERTVLLAADVADSTSRATQERDARRQALRRALADIERREVNVLRQAAEGDADDPFTKGLRITYNELDDQRRATSAELDELDAAAAADDIVTGPHARHLLDTLPQLGLTLHDAPDVLQRNLSTTSPN